MATIKNNLREFSNIIILRDTPETRFAFGSPIDENALKNGNFGLDENNPFYKKLLDQNFQHGWRTGYPYLDSALEPGIPPLTGPGSDESGSNLWVNAIRNNTLQSLGSPGNVTLGYNNPPASSGTGIIVDDIFYVGNLGIASYTSITSNSTDVTVAGVTGIASIPNGSKVMFSEVGTSDLETDTVYYAYNYSSGSFKVSNNSSTYAAITSLSGTAGTGQVTVAGSNFEFVSPTTFTLNTLEKGDFLFWGDDNSSLNIGGKIEEVYASGTADHNMGKRYRFAKNTKNPFPEDENDNIIPQSIYYYKKNWNGKNVKNNQQVNANEIGGGFYVLIKIELNNSGAPLCYPYFGYDNPGENYAISKLVDSNSPEKYVFLEHVRVRKISNRFVNDETVDSLSAGELIPCTMHRTSNFFNNVDNLDSNGKLKDLFGGSNVPFPAICPEWCAYYVNPYGGSTNKLDKNSTYVLEINERLPAVAPGDINSKLDFLNYAFKGSI